MGHYYSEMVSKDKQDKELKRKEEIKQRSIKKLKESIKEKCIEEILLDIINDDGWKYRG